MHFAKKPNETYEDAYRRLNLIFAGVDERVSIFFHERESTVEATLKNIRAYLLSQTEYD